MAVYTKLYAIKGMSCENCASRVSAAFKSLPAVINAQILPESGQAVINMKEMLPIEAINAALQKAGNYTAQESNEAAVPEQKAKKTPAFLQFLRHKKACCQ